MLDVEIQGQSKLEQAGTVFAGAKERLRDLLSRASQDFANRAVTVIKRDYLSGGADKLKVRTGRLRSSIRYLLAESDGEIGITFGSDVPYAAIHEFGGKTQAHRIEPRRKKFLRFLSGGKEVFSRGVDHPGSLVPKRPFLTPGVEDELPAFRATIDNLLRRAATEGLA